MMRLPFFSNLGLKCVRSGRLSRSFVWLYFLPVVTAWCATPPANERLCVVYPFEARDGASAAAADLLTRRYAALMVDTSGYQILAGEALQARLEAQAFQLPKEASIEVTALRAARLVGAPYSVFGTVSRSGNRYTLETGLLEVRDVRILRVVRSSYTGDLHAFIRLAPPQNIATLLQPRARSGGAEPSVQRPYQPATDGGRRPWRPEWDRIGKASKEYLGGRLELGTRVSFFGLLNDHKDTFLGTIDQLEAQQNYAPVKIFAYWRLPYNLGIELGWDTIETRAVTKWDGHNDGNIVAKGPLVSLQWRYPTRTRMTPYAAFGFGYFSAEFNAESWWNLGYPSKTEWIDSGQPSSPYAGYRRNMDLDNVIPIILRGGCSVALTENIAADVFLRYMHIEVDDHYYISRGGETFDDRGITGIPLHNIGLGLGVKYVF